MLLGFLRTRRPARVGVVVTAVSCLAMTACGGGGESGGAGPAARCGDTPGGFPCSVEHAMGTTTIDRQPKTVAALDSSYVDAALALETRVVAATTYPVDGPQLPSYLSDQDKRYGSGSKVIGELTTPDVEQLYDVAPDLIVSAKIRHEKIYDELSNVAPTVFSESTGATWKANLRLLAKALGKQDLAERKIRDYAQRARAIGRQIEAKAGKQVTASLVRFTEGEPTVRLYSSASFPGIVLRDAGLSRPQGQPDSREDISVDLSQENITKLDADRIFVSTYADPREQESNPKQQFQSNPLWRKLNGEITEVDDTSWVVSVSLQGAHTILDDLARQFGVDPVRP